MTEQNGNNSAGSDILLPSRHLRLDAPLRDIGKLMFYHMRQRLGDKASWDPWMWQVADWIRDNQGRSLLLYGPPGTGKTFMAQHVISTVFQKHGITLHIVTAQMLADPVRHLEDSTYRIIDDVGAEPAFRRNGLPNRRFCQIVDRATQARQLLIVTTNLYPATLFRRYGARTYDRLKEYRGIRCDGESKRNNDKNH